MITRLRYDSDVGIITLDFKTAMTNTLRTLIEKVDNMQEQMGNVSREMGSLRIKKKW